MPGLYQNKPNHFIISHPKSIKKKYDYFLLKHLKRIESNKKLLNEKFKNLCLKVSKENHECYFCHIDTVRNKYDVQVLLFQLFEDRGLFYLHTESDTVRRRIDRLNWLR